MLSQNQRKFIRSLDQKKIRQENRLFVVEGDKMVRELLQQDRVKVQSVYALKDWAEAHRNLLDSGKSLFYEISESELNGISNLQTPNRALALAAFPPQEDIKSLLDRHCFYLDGIQDPGNLGSILRIADWFGMPAVFCSPNTVDVFNSKVVQASMGAIFRVFSAEIELSGLLDMAPDIQATGAVLNGENLFNADLPSSGLIVIGSEGKGISEKNENLLTRRVSVPRHPDGGAESLNAAIAAGILASWFIRDRL